MRIGLIGAPGSGKTILAETVKKAVEIQNGEEHSCVVIDGYVDELAKTTGLAIGEMGGYLANLNIALDREVRERWSYHAMDTYGELKAVITCGTLLDTATYVAMDGASLLKQGDEAERLDDVRRIEATMKVLACLYIDAFKYDHLFYLPSGAGEFDKNLQVAFQAFNLVKVTPLMEGGSTALETVEKRCVEVLKTIHQGA